MNLPEKVRRLFRNWGRQGGRARARKMRAVDRSAGARAAVCARWQRERFGSASFQKLGLPGGDLVDEGIRDLSLGRRTIPALLISIAFPRLRRQGVALPRKAFPRSDVKLFRLLEKESGDDLAHARYTAHLRRISSFADALDRLHGVAA